MKLIMLLYAVNWLVLSDQETVFCYYFLTLNTFLAFSYFDKLIAYMHFPLRL